MAEERKPRRPAEAGVPPAKDRRPRADRQVAPAEPSGKGGERGELRRELKAIAARLKELRAEGAQLKERRRALKARRHELKGSAKTARSAGS